MKKTFIILSVALVVVLITLYFFMGGSGTTPGNNNTNPLPAGNNTGTTPGTPLGQTGSTVVSDDDATALQVARDFNAQARQSNPLAVLEKPVVVYPYALQPWHDENVAATAILRHSNSDGWVLLGGEGGVINEDVLVHFGVPYSFAKKLVEALNK